MSTERGFLPRSKHYLVDSMLHVQQDFNISPKKKQCQTISFLSKKKLCVKSQNLSGSEVVRSPCNRNLQLHLLLKRGEMLMLSGREHNVVKAL